MGRGRRARRLRPTRSVEGRGPWSSDRLRAGQPEPRSRRGRRGEPGNPGVEKGPAPELERDQGPELQVQIAAPVVLRQEPRDVARVEDVAAPAGLRQEQVADEAAELTPEPPSERDCEPLLAPVDDLVGQDASHGLFEDRLGHAVPQPDRKSTRLNSSHITISYAV